MQEETAPIEEITLTEEAPTEATAYTEEVRAIEIYEADHYGKNQVTFIIDDVYLITVDLMTRKASFAYYEEAISEGRIIPEI